MPYLLIQTNIALSDDRSLPLLRKSSQTTAEILGKPEQYVMVAVHANQPMLFAGKDDPLAYLNLKSIGLPKDKTKALSQALCELIHSELNIDKDRIYIEFVDAERAMWGWNSTTFEK